MYIATNEACLGSRAVINVLPREVGKYMCNTDLDSAEEIRLISGRPISVRFPDGVYYLSRNAVLSDSCKNAIIVNEGHMRELMERMTKSSVYSVKEEMKNGYITLDGGHRAGIAGTAVTENGMVDFIKNISAVNIRIAREVKGAADLIIDRICSGVIKSTLIISPPCAGKTTMLRDIARSLSQRGHSVAIADERCELAAMHNGRSSFDLGNHTTVLDNCPKADAMLMLLRSMSPEVIITDEIGTSKDAEAIYNIMNSGVAVMASIHGRDIKQLVSRRGIARLINMFDLVVTLSRRNGAGTIEEIRENV